jgi:hypothetical protein
MPSRERLRVRIKLRMFVWFFLKNDFIRSGIKKRGVEGGLHGDVLGKV